MTFIQKIRSIYFWIYYHTFGANQFDIKLSGGREIRSNNINKCVDCGCYITPENDSGWECFVNAGYTQSICKKCEEIRSTNDSDCLKLED